ncbi:hypothetical protein LZ32DRAFT_97222 [Colletotrichum eremochloae]|nr:hypothetical protein LZ32DRAFT_97222 [Colletotrichum eremochloae]
MAIDKNIASIRRSMIRYAVRYQSIRGPTPSFGYPVTAFKVALAPCLVRPPTDRDKDWYHPVNRRGPALVKPPTPSHGRTSTSPPKLSVHPFCASPGRQTRRCGTNTGMKIYLVRYSIHGIATPTKPTVDSRLRMTWNRRDGRRWLHMLA